MTHHLPRPTCRLRPARLLALGAVTVAALAAWPAAPRPARAEEGGQYAMIVLDSLYCERESDRDALTDDDEPYVLATGFASHPRPRAWSTGRPEIFSLVDSHENRRFTQAQRKIYEGVVPLDGTVGFHLFMMENDGWSPDREIARYQESLHDDVSHRIETWHARNPGEAALEGISIAFEGIFYLGVLGIAWPGHVLSGADDDYVGKATVAFTGEQLRKCAEQAPQRGATVTLGGSSEGKYKIRYHVVLDPKSIRSYQARFSAWDDLVAGNFMGDQRDECLIAANHNDLDGARSHDMSVGRFIIRGLDPRGSVRVNAFERFYTRYDRIAAGNLLGEPYDEIVVASDDDGGWIRIYDASGSLQRSFSARFTPYDGLAVGNVLGDTRPEILVACDDDRKVYLYDAAGTKVGEFAIPFRFDGVRYTSDHSRQDAFLVGDVGADARAEILFIDHRPGGSEVYTLAADGSEVGFRFKVYWGRDDAATLGDRLRDGKRELLIATEVNESGEGAGRLLTYAIPQGRQPYLADERYSPRFTRYDGFAAGDFWGVNGKAQFLVATDEDQRLYVAR